MNNTPFFSIGIPVFNRKNYITEAINSVISQSFTDFELIVVDNYSQDGTWEYLQSLQNTQIKVYRNTNNIGMVNNWVKCIEYANGKWFKFLMSDDILLQNSLSHLYDLINKEYNIKAIISKGCIINSLSMINHNEYYKIENKVTLIRDITTYHYEFSVNPNSYTLLLSDLRELINSQEFIEVNHNLGETGHIVDFYIFNKIALKYSCFIKDYYSMYAFRIHNEQGSRKYNSNLNYHIRGDRYINNKLIIIPRYKKLFVFSHLIRLFLNKIKNKENNFRFWYKIFADICKFCLTETYYIITNKNEFNIKL